ncbi:MAG TPA: hypothetical protein VFS00_01415 [Polyangiaceae bacterium]|nr:hypothetical protein [Polyangiaceae bacterium]
MALGVACSQAESPEPGAPATPDFCAAAYGERCGVACADDAGCGAGLYCAFGACTAECTAASGCGAGFTCGPLGRCTATAPAPTVTAPPPPPLPAEVIAATRARYVEGYERITGRRFADWPGVA